MDEPERIVRSVLGELAQRPLGEEVSAETRLGADLGLTSLSIVAAVFRLEDELAADVIGSGVEVGAMRTVADVIQLARALVQAKGS